MLTVGTTDLDEVLVSDGLENLLLLLKFGEIDVDGSSHAGTEVGGAGRNVTEMAVVLELGDGLNLGGGDRKALEDLTDVRSLLHRDDSELIFLVDPDQESLIVIVEDTTGLGPFSLQTAGLEVLVATLEQEVISNKRISFGSSHTCKGVVLSLELTFKGG
jgi:hypothetical protein